MEKRRNRTSKPVATAALPSDKNNNVNVVLLNQVMEAFNNATVKLQSSYELLQDEARKLREEIEDKNRKLSYMSNLLGSVLNNTRSAILVVDQESEITLKNNAGKKLIRQLGLRNVMQMLLSAPSEGVFDYDNGNGTFFRLSADPLISETLQGTVFVVDDITSIKKQETETQRSEKLQLMGEMAANIAHEIRNPLGSMELFASLLERELHDPGQKKLTSNIIKAIRIINGTISNTLLFTKEMQPEKQTYVLADIVDEVVLYLQHRLREKNISILNKLDENHMLECDRDLFRQVVMNLVHNSIDAVQDGGTIAITSKSDDKWLTFSVCDNGCGIKQEIRNKLFMPFQTTKAKGTGLGLSIVYKIVRAHGGDITVNSDGYSHTEFNVTIPHVVLDNV